MVTECWAIIIVIFCISFIFLRSGRGAYALSVLPLAIFPAFHLMGRVVSRTIAAHSSLSQSLLQVGIDVSGLAIACILMGFASQKIKNRRQRLALLIISAGFTLILAWILLFEVL